MTEFERLAERIKTNNPVNPIFKDRNRDTGLKFLSDKKTEELRKKFRTNVENIKLRNDWLEASRRKNYEMEHDRLKNEYNTILNKNPNATSLNLLKDRMNNLKALAEKSVKGEKHEIYARDSTGGHATTGDSAGGDIKITLGVNQSYLKPKWTCPVCDRTMLDSNMANHLDGKRHEMNVKRRARGLPPL